MEPEARYLAGIHLTDELPEELEISFYTMRKNADRARQISQGSG